MSNKKRTLIVVIFLFLVVAFTIVYIFSELYNEDEILKSTISDAIKFKIEYEEINDKEVNNVSFRKVNIREDNPMIYISAKDLVKKINNKDSFVVYFGFSSCPWCRSIIESLIESGMNNKISKIYYVDIKDIRDKYELDDNNKAIKTVEGTKDYYDLLELLDVILDDYEDIPYTVKNKKKYAKIDEKRIYAPNVILVKDGIPTLKTDGIPAKLTDAYMSIDDEMKKESIDKFNCLFEGLNNNSSTCKCEDNLC